MKSLKYITLFIISFIFISQSAEAGIRVPVGEIEVLYKVADLPDTAEFLVNEAHQDTRVVKVGGDKSTPAEYADIGILYTEYVIAYIPLWTTKDPTLVLYNEKNKDQYSKISDEDMNSILKQHNLDRDSLLDTGFFTKIGGKLIALVLLIIILFGIKAYLPSKKKGTENQ